MLVILKYTHVLGHMLKWVDVMSTPKTWATFWPKTMNEVITMQTHWSRCGQQKKQVTLWPMKETGHFVANKRNRTLCGQVISIKDCVLGVENYY